MSKASEKTAELVVPAPAVVAPVSMFQGLIDGAHVIDGGELLKDNEEGFISPDELVGVPFAWTRATYRKGDITQKGNTEPDPYVSLEFTLGDEHWMKRRRVNLDKLPFDPEDALILNDGSTGIMRQVTEYLHAAEYIVVATKDKLVRGGNKGESSFDLPPHKWHEINRGDMYFDDEGYGIYTVEFAPAVFCKRGIRVSEYQNEWTKDGKTRYIA